MGESLIKTKIIWTGSSWNPTFSLPEKINWDNILVISGISGKTGTILGAIIQKMTDGESILYDYENDVNVDYDAHFKRISYVSGQFSQSSAPDWSCKPFTSISIVYLEK